MATDFCAPDIAKAKSTKGLNLSGFAVKGYHRPTERPIHLKPFNGSTHFIRCDLEIVTVGIVEIDRVRNLVI